MKIAIITLTDAGHDLSIQISEGLKKDPTVFEIDIFKKNVNKVLNTIFYDYDCIIGIMAVGIMVRNICPLIRNKMEDPAVLIVDDNGKQVISLLSGHLGGANELSKKIAGIINANPIITTATDTHEKMGIDTLARKHHLDILNPEKIKIINKALIEDRVVGLAVPLKFDFIFNDPLVWNSYKKYPSEKNSLEAFFGNDKVVLKPKKFVLGIGTRKGVTSSKIIDFIAFIMNILDLPFERIDAMATTEIKKNEPGIIETALRLNIPLEIIPLNVLKDFKNVQCSESELVRDKFGISGVCEPSALIAAGGNSRLILKKTSKNGVSLAVAVS